MFNIINGLDNPALLISALFLTLFLIKKNKLSFLIIAEVVFLSNWFLFMPESYATPMLYDCLTVIVSGAIVVLARSNIFILIAHLYFLVFNTASWIVNSLYYKNDSSLFLYNLSMFLLDSYILYVFVPFLAFCVIGCLYTRGNDNGRRRINTNDRAFCDGDLLHDIHGGGYLGYREKRF